MLFPSNEPLPSEYDGFNRHELLNSKRWLIILIETQRFKKAFPKKGRIGDYDLKKRCNDILYRASNHIIRKPIFGGNFQTYMERFSIYNSYTNEKYYTLEQTGKKFWRFKIDRIIQRVESEKKLSVNENHCALYRKHGVFAFPNGYVINTNNSVLAFHGLIGPISDSVKRQVNKARSPLPENVSVFDCSMFSWKSKKCC
jgi:hypothetical protein